MQGANYRAKASVKKAAGQLQLVLGAGNRTPVACVQSISIVSSPGTAKYPRLRLILHVLQGANYRAKASGRKAAGHVSLVLGAGNQTPVACMDILHKLFVDDAVAVCKMNPVNEYLGEYIR